MKKSRLLWKQVLLYSLIFFVFILGLIYLAYANLADISTGYLRMSQFSKTGTIMLHTDQYLDPMLRIATQVSHDTEVIRLMQELDGDTSGSRANHFLTEKDDRETLSGILAGHNNAITPMHRISVYNITGDYVCDTPDLDTLRLGSAATQQPALTDQLSLLNQQDYIFIGPYGDSYGDGDETYISLILPIRDLSGTAFYGYVEIQQATSLLFASIEPIIPETSELFLFYGWDENREHQIYPPDQPYPAAEIDSFFETTHTSEYDWKIVLLRHRSTLMDDFKPLITVLLLGILSLYILLLICIYLVARFTNRPIMQLNDKIKQVTLDHIPDQPVTAEATDEVKELEHSFDLMVQRLNTSFQLEKKAYLNALQAQMNPHFLYNCLSTISGMSVPPYNEQIPVFCNRLAAILRYETVYDDKPVTLADELQNVRNYLELMKLRHEEDFTYELEADESLLELRMPRLILQPIVENCFEHGFRSVAPPWHIAIRIAREDSRWSITVQDNGCGFDEEKRQQLLRDVDELMSNLGENYSELKIGGLGLVNTIARLRLVSDDGLVYTITPGTPNGTIVTLKGGCHD